MALIAKERLIDFGARLLVKKGVSAERAACLAPVAVATEAMGIHTHGVVLFAHWDKFVGDTIDPSAEPEVVAERPATAAIDGHASFGQLALKVGREIAVGKARACGVAMVAGRNMSWLAALTPQILPLAEAGFFAQLWVQDNAYQDCAPWGGIDPRFSTNPIALAFPTGSLPMVSDFSTSSISMGKTRVMKRTGQCPPEDLFLDGAGYPTTNPHVVKNGGSMLFLGGEHYGYRGYALSLWAEALAAMAGGSCNNPAAPPSQSFNLTVIDPEAFGSRDHCLAEIQRFIAYMKDNRLRPGFDAIRLPGERAQAAAREAEARGVFVEDSMVEMLNEVAARNGLEGPSLS